VGLEGRELMPFERAGLSALRAQAAADLAAAVPGADPLLPVSNLGILADMLAEGFNGAYGYLDYIARQAVPFTAEDEAFQGWAALKGVTQKPATAAKGFGTWTGAPGTLLPADTPVSRGDGVTYRTTEDATVGGGGTVTAPIEAREPGSPGTITNGVSMLLGQSIAGIVAAGTAVSVLPGVDLEEFDDFRARVLDIYANPPQGGAISDYEEWALQVPGVTRAWCTPNGMGPGTSVVYFMMDSAEVAFGGFPQGTDGVAGLETRDVSATGDQLAVADWIYPLRPVTALVYAQAPKANEVDFTIVLPGASLAVKAAIEAAIVAVFLDGGQPGGTVNMSVIGPAIAALSGTDGFVITATTCTHGSVSPATGNITSNPGYLPVRGLTDWD
jgi:uncharacterized phage protein gp47/JayE